MILCYSAPRDANNRASTNDVSYIKDAIDIHQRKLDPWLTCWSMRAYPGAHSGCGAAGRSTAWRPKCAAQPSCCWMAEQLACRSCRSDESGSTQPLTLPTTCAVCIKHKSISRAVCLSLTVSACKRVTLGSGLELKYADVLQQQLVGGKALMMKSAFRLRDRETESSCNTPGSPIVMMPGTAHHPCRIGCGSTLLIPQGKLGGARDAQGGLGQNQSRLGGAPVHNAAQH